MQYRVRKNFVLHRPDRPPASGGSIVDLTAIEFEKYAHQLEPYEVIPLVEGSIAPEPETIETEPEPTEPPPKRRSRKKDPDPEPQNLEEELTNDAA